MRVAVLQSLNLSSTRQTGVITVLLAVLLIVSATSISLIMAKANLLELKVVLNRFQAREAFLNAEAGLSHAFSVLGDQQTRAAQFSEQGFLLVSDLYQLTVSKVAGAVTAWSIVSQGHSDGGAAKAKAQIEVEVGASMLTMPDSGLLVNGDWSFRGREIYNDGCDGFTAGDCSAAENIATKMARIKGVKSSHAGFEQLGFSMLETGEFGQDAFADSKIQSDKLFQGVFGVPETPENKAWLQDLALLVGSEGCSEALFQHKAKGGLVWLKGNCQLEPRHITSQDHTGGSYLTLGSRLNPVLLVVEGGSLSGVGLNVFGIVFFLPAAKESPTRLTLGTSKISGAMLVDYADVVAQSPESSLVVEYDKLSLSALKSRLTTDGFRITPGSWKDF